MDGRFPSRTRGTVVWREGDGLAARRPGGVALRLDAATALVWTLADGTRRAADLAGELATLYPDQRGEIDRQLPDALAILRGAGLLGDQAAAAPAWPILRVAFAALGPGLDEPDNPLARLLAERWAVFVVPPESVPDLLVFGTAGPAPRADPERTLRVLYAPSGVAPGVAADGYDAALVGEGPGGGRRVALPSWSLFVDWDGRRDAVGRHPDGGRLHLADPRLVCDRLAAVLAAAVDVVDVAGPPPPAPAATPVPAAPSVAPAPAATPDLTIGMATYADFDGVYFTVQALRLFHPEIAALSEILIVDNDPRGPAAAALRGLAAAVPGGRYEAFDEHVGTAVRDLVFRAARAPYVVCLDSHVLVVPGALRRLLAWFEERPETPDLVQGPLLYDDHATVSTHFQPIWSAGMYGVWGTDPRGVDPEAPPFEVPMQGLGLFACRRAAWPGFNPRFRGFGGEEGYLHEKVRRHGGRALCLPFLRWMHRFVRPAGAAFPNTWEDRLRNYLIGHAELGLDPGPAEAHFREVLGEETFTRLLREVRSELADPLARFDAVYVLGDAAATGPVRHAATLGERYDPADPVATALAHRTALARAERRGLETVLVLGGDLPAVDRAGLGPLLDEAWPRPWRALVLAPGLAAVGYHRRVFAALLAEIPADADAAAAWVARTGGLARRLAELVEAAVAAGASP